MWKYLLVVIALMGISGATYFKMTQATIAELNQRLAAYEVREAIQKETIDSLVQTAERNQNALNDLMNANAVLEAEKDRYLDIFKRHNLTRLAAAKPQLIQKSINEGTKDVFDSIEKASAFIDDTVE
jgi:uncharacterized coiled-coil protein SlyX